MAVKNDLEKESKYAWWSALNHNGLLITSPKLIEFFPDEPKALSDWEIQKLRNYLDLLKLRDYQKLSEFIDFVLEKILGLNDYDWIKEKNISSDWSRKAITGENIKPQRIWQSSESQIILPVFIDNPKDKKNHSSRLGVGKGKRFVSRVLEWLRKSNNKIAIITNGFQWRLIFAGSDYDAWCEWDTDLWFQEGKESLQIKGLQILLGKNSLISKEEQDPSLLSAILASRQGQAELSNEIGERVRKSIELLIRESSISIENLQKREDINISERDIYIAATRIIMRCVFILFAESRDLLPRYNPIYHTSYGIQGLREQLGKRSGGQANLRLNDSYGAWPRLLALFKLIYEGSLHESLPVRKYGGRLFQSGNETSENPVLQALTAFENIEHCPPDSVVYTILDYLTQSKMKVKQGKSSIYIPVPVDFSDLSSEYIGILYEGLLDFELKKVAENEPMIFINVGDQPVLPLARLEQMDDSDLTSLIQKLKKANKADSDEEDPEEETTEKEKDIQEEVIIEDDITDEEIEETDEISLVKKRAIDWAIKAVGLSKLIPKPKKNDKTAQETYSKNLFNTAKSLILKIVMPGEWYLVRWGGTRKGAGTFYTRPQLVVPVVKRTLHDLLYETSEDENSLQNFFIPKKPEVILNLKVCEPSMGSGSFLVASLRFLTEALFESLHFHNRIEEHGSTTLCRLADGQGTNDFIEETLPVPKNHDDFEEILKGRLKRYLVERCLYGVDLDPLAVELSKLALWIETMDRDLPFGFLDHKLKCGNSIVGCWFDRFQDYPIMAWEREGGDKNHKGIHFEKEEWTKEIKRVKDEIVKPELKMIIETLDPQIKIDIPQFLFDKNAYDIHSDAEKTFNELHSIPLHENEKREDFYQEKLEKNQTLKKLKFAFDTWCSIWFWPADKLNISPTPEKFYNPTEDTILEIKNLKNKYRFFHWELEFPDVFTENNSGFDAIIGNPPWDIAKPNSQEFFSNIDPLYRSYDKKEADTYQNKYFNNSQLEREWLIYNSHFKALSNWVLNVSSPFGLGKKSISLARGKENDRLVELFKGKISERKGYSKKDHPFQYQGSADINTYKLILELSLFILNKNSKLSLILPSSVHNDKGSLELRKQWLNNLDTLIKFDNEKQIFRGLEHNSKFDIITISFLEKRKSKVAFFAWKDASILDDLDNYLLDISEEYISKVSPDTLSVPELRNQSDKEIIEKMYNNGIIIGDKNKVFNEFHLTNDRKYFYSDGDIPVYQGGMIWHHDHRYNFFNSEKKDFERGKLENVELRYKYPLKARYWTNVKEYLSKFVFTKRSESSRLIDGIPHISYFRIVYRIQSSRSNQRTFVTSIIPPGCSTGNSLGCFIDPDYTEMILFLSILTSFANDFNVRTKISSNINSFYIPQLVSPKIDINSNIGKTLIMNTLKLLCTTKLFKELYDEIANKISFANWNIKNIALTPYERLRLRAINDSIIFYLFDFQIEEVEYILSTFEGVDSKVIPRLRQNNITLLFFKALKDMGIDEFLNTNNGQGLMILSEDKYFSYKNYIFKPDHETLIVLGERFYDWQIDDSIDSNWEKCNEIELNIKDNFLQKMDELYFSKKNDILDNTEQDDDNKKEQLSIWGQNND